MSSPQVLTFVSCSLSVARASAREACDEYIARAMEADSTLTARSQALAQRGIIVPRPQVESIPDVDSKATRLIASALPQDASIYVHSYYQRLKHPWLEQIAEQESRLLVADAAREVAEKTKQVAVLVVDQKQVQQHTEADYAAGKLVRGNAGETTKVAPVSNPAVGVSFDDRLEKALCDARATAITPGDAEEIEKEIAEILEGPRSIAIHKVEALECRRNQKFLDAKYASIAKAKEAQDRQECLARVERSIARAEHLLTTVGEQRAVEFQARFCAEIEQVKAGDWMAGERNFEKIRATLMEEAAQKPRVLEVIRELKKLGYAEVKGMETITPGDLQVSHLAMPNDSSRVLELTFSASKQALAVEVVRTAADNYSDSQKGADTEAQTTACKHLDHIFDVTLKGEVKAIHRRDRAGQKMQVRKRRKAKVGYGADAASHVQRQSAQL